MRFFYKKVLSLMLIVAMVMGFSNPISVSAEAVKGWQQLFENGAEGTVTLDKDDYKSGPAALKVTLDSTFASGGNIHIYQNLNLVAGREYTINMSVKAKRSNIFRLMLDWEMSLICNPFSESFGWTDLSSKFVPSETKSYKLWLWVKGETKAVWVDNIEVIDSVTGENLVVNGSFDEGVTASQAKEDEDEKKLEQMLGNDTVDMDNLFHNMAVTDCLPVFFKGDRNVVIDGNTSEWEDVESMYLPILDKQKVEIIAENEKDNEVWAKFLCDDVMLYVLIEVKDNIHNAVISDRAWTADSVQMMLGQKGGSYGIEFTFSFDEEGNTYVNYGSMNPAYEDLIQFVGKREGDISTYEIAIPWAAQFGECPTDGQACFNFLVNDADDNGRGYCIEWDAGGISKSKSSESSPQIVIIDSEKEVYGWIQNVVNAKTKTEYDIPVYVCNNGDEKVLEITCEQTGLKRTIKAKAGQVVLVSTKIKWDNVVSDYPIEIKVSYDGGELLLKQTVNVEELYDAVSVQALADTYRVWAGEIRELMQECAEKNISTVYEQTAVGLLERFAEYFEGDIEYDNYAYKGYQSSALEKIYRKAKSDLEAYLDGSKAAKTATKYVTDDQPLHSEGRTVYGMTETDGVLEERPVFFIGYGHFDTAASDYEFFDYIGANANQYSALPSASREQGWKITAMGAPDYSITRDTTVKASGNSSMKLYYGEAWNANKYVHISQEIAVEPNTKYIFKFKSKSESGSETGMKIDEWRKDGISGTTGIAGGTYDWTENEAEITTQEGQTTLTLTWILNSNKVAWIDDVSLCKKGSSKNLIMDPGCENVGNSEFIFDEKTEAVQSVRKYLESAEENNIAVSVLVSPHVMGSEYTSKWYSVADFAVNGALDDEKLLSRWETNLRGWAKLLNEYKSVHSICIANEPVFYSYAYGNGEHYTGAWKEFLKENYESIENLNKAWKTEYTSFDEIVLLDYGATEYDGTVQRNDYSVFNSKLASAFYRRTAEILKEETDIPITIKILAYMWPAYYRVDGVRGNDMAEYHDFLDWEGGDTMHESDSAWGDYPHEFWYDYLSTFDDSPIVNDEDHNVRDKDAMSERIALERFDGEMRK